MGRESLSLGSTRQRTKGCPWPPKTAAAEGSAAYMPGERFLVRASALRKRVKSEAGCAGFDGVCALRAVDPDGLTVARTAFTGDR